MAFHRPKKIRNTKRKKISLRVTDLGGQLGEEAVASITLWLTHTGIIYLVYFLYPSPEELKVGINMALPFFFTRTTALSERD